MFGKTMAMRIVCLLGFFSTFCLSVRGQAWDFLGDAQIDRTRDHDRILVTRRDGIFHTIQLRVCGDPIFLDRVVVHFEDGTTEELAVGDRIWPGGRNRIMGLSGKPHMVESVEVWYYKEPWDHNPRVILYGSR